MKESEWLKCEDPERMLEFLGGNARKRGRASHRSLWLFIVACFQRRGRSLDPDIRRAVAMTERYVEWQATDEEMREYNSEINARSSAEHAIKHCRAKASNKRKEVQAQAHLLREVVGNPFRPVTFAPAWRTDTVLVLARQIDESRDFSPMPILADALQDAGCDNEDVLNHCRGPGPHVRGCWVIDLILEKEDRPRPPKKRVTSASAESAPEVDPPARKTSRKKPARRSRPAE